ncbi:unnamed protein product [Staurois parvus]|uniref:Uncharacterized protein n=1 Tax=Staurois parvus TaxID=386267 RepID=A0ABN9CN94_9NEOB|nr:unnamed protein product [Staurois parvus]
MKAPTLLRIIASIKPVCIESASDLVVSGTPVELYSQGTATGTLVLRLHPIKLKKIQEGTRGEYDKQEECPYANFL